MGNFFSNFPTTLYNKIIVALSVVVLQQAFGFSRNQIK